MPTTPPGYRVYIVLPGETLFDIAEKFNVPLQELAEVNQITDPTSIKAGNELLVPIS